MFNEDVYDNAGNLIQTIAYDLDAGTVTVDNQDGSPTSDLIEPGLLAALRDEAANRIRRTRLDTAAATLRQWAADAASTNVTNGNNTAVTQTVVDRLGVFFERFADLLEERR